jgi:hypothetical protein
MMGSSSGALPTMGFYPEDLAKQQANRGLKLRRHTQSAVHLL